MRTQATTTVVLGQAKHVLTHANSNSRMDYTATEIPADQGTSPCLQQGTKPDMASCIDPPPPGWIPELLPAALSLLMHLY